MLKLFLIINKVKKIFITLTCFCYICHQQMVLRYLILNYTQISMQKWIIFHTAFKFYFILLLRCLTCGFRFEIAMLFCTVLQFHLLGIFEMKSKKYSKGIPDLPYLLSELCLTNNSFYLFSEIFPAETFPADIFIAFSKQLCRIYVLPSIV